VTDAKGEAPGPDEERAGEAIPADEAGAADELLPDAEERASAVPGPRRAWLTIVIAVVVILLDQLTKLWAVNALAGGAPRPLVGDLIRFQLTTNAGASFSIGSQSTWIFTIVAAAAVIVISWFMWTVRSLPWAIALGLLLGGAATHLGDRLFRPPAFGEGHVVDFINYFGLFIGNVADIMLVSGAVMLVILALLGIRTGREDPTRAGDGASAADSIEEIAEGQDAADAPEPPREE
jgi:signal peptidase II